jgi:hypothetical protein
LTLAEIEIALDIPETATGVNLDVVVPSPNCPLPFHPQQNNAPAESREQAPPMDAETATAA